MKLCKDCRHFGGGYAPISKCYRAEASSIDPVSGERIGEYATILRSPHGMCGIEGRLFEGKSSGGVLNWIKSL